MPRLNYFRFIRSAIAVGKMTSSCGFSPDLGLYMGDTDHAKSRSNPVESAAQIQLIHYTIGLTTSISADRSVYQVASRRL